MSIMPSARRKRTYSGRNRTSSSPSLEIQVTQSEPIISEPQYGLMAPNEQLLNVLKSVGAKGSWTPNGSEVFSIRQLYSLLIAYIRKHCLYDPINPLVVYCKEDELGKAFGVDRFTQRDAVGLLIRNSREMLPGSSNKAQCKIGSVAVAASTHHHRSSPIPPNSARPELQGARAFAVPTSQNVPQREPNPALPSIQTAAVDELLYEPECKKAKHEGNSPSSSPVNEPRRVRARQSSVSIVYSDADVRGSAHGDYDWRLTFTSLRVNESDTESVYSVQSKETALARDSSDDYWFVEDDEENDNGEADMDAISVQLGNEGISLEINTSDGPFSEYELVSEDSETDYDTDGSESPREEIVVFYESDEEFWADSESSDNECELSADEEMSDGDKWTCLTCGELNYPLRRNCDRCWAVRPAWLPRKQAGEKKCGEPDSTKVPPCDKNGIGSETTECVQACSDLASSFQSSNEMTSELKAANSVESNQNFQTSLQKGDTLLSDELDINSSLRITSPDLMGQHRRLFSSNDSGLGSSLTSFSTPECLDMDSGISSQEPPSQIECIQDGDSALLTSEQAAYSSVTSDKGTGQQACTVSRSFTSSSSPGMCPIVKLDFQNNGTAKQEKVSFARLSPMKRSPVKSMDTAEGFHNMCMICLSKPKEASIIHGKTGHQVCCYVCAKRLKRKGKSCPVCRRPIAKVIKNYLV